ncbi:MAG: FHA domain-containing protein [Planctomycetes bacterium]|nr:FHA domain-containing protein [Planctomycetota bacterium]
MINEPTAPTPENLQDLLAPYALWIDGVGGYLVCLSHRVTIGQAQGETPVDIALIADVSRHHATIQRDTEGYFLEASRKVLINANAMDKALLRSGDRITLGASCQLQFWQPVPASTSARLDMVSGHRFAQPVQAVLLMADTLVIGPAAQSHVIVADMTQPLILFRTKAGLSARWSGTLQINGKSFQERGPLEAGARLANEQITLALERIS